MEEILTAGNGKVYQNVNDKHSYGKTIYIGKNDNAKNWILINEKDIPEPKEPLNEELLQLK